MLARGTLRRPPLPGQPLPRIFRDRLLAQRASRFCNGRRRPLLARVYPREPFGRGVPSSVAGLLALFPERVPETDRVRVRAPGRPGVAAVLMERPHAARELSSHVANLPSGSQASVPRSPAAAVTRSASRDASAPHADPSGSVGPLTCTDNQTVDLGLERGTEHGETPDLPAPRLRFCGSRAVFTPCNQSRVRAAVPGFFRTHADRMLTSPMGPQSSVNGARGRTHLGRTSPRRPSRTAGISVRNDPGRPS